MRKGILIFLVLGSISMAWGQIPIDLNFNAVNNGSYIHLDSIKIMNRTEGGYTMLYWPDTSLTINITPGDLMLYIGYSTGYPVGVLETNSENKQFHLFQNSPNPVEEECDISMYIPEKGTVKIMITDIKGRLINTIDKQFDAGYHSFRFIPGGEIFYLMRVRWNGRSQCIKILSTGSNSGKSCMLDLTGSRNSNHSLKVSLLKNDLIMLESGILDAPLTNENYTFQFATNIPCPGMSTVEYEGQVYNTIQIFSQCWLKENLNVGTMISSSQSQTNNSIIEKYCYNDQYDSCTKYGGLYRWNEMMKYTNIQGTQGICPQGWHLPTVEEWKLLDGAVDSQYGIGDQEWQSYYHWSGFDAGINMKTTYGWYSSGNGVDLYGFSGLPGGLHFVTYSAIGESGMWWTSNERQDIGNNAWARWLFYSNQGVNQGYNSKQYGYSVRCLRDN